jgi:hypothetical protein
VVASELHAVIAKHFLARSRQPVSVLLQAGLDRAIIAHYFSAEA